MGITHFKIVTGRRIVCDICGDTNSMVISYPLKVDIADEKITMPINNKMKKIINKLLIKLINSVKPVIRKEVRVCQTCVNRQIRRFIKNS